MNIYRLCLAIFCSILLSGCLAGTKVRTQPDPGDPTANFPKMCVGDTFTRKNFSGSTYDQREQFTYKVDKVNSDGSFEMLRNDQPTGDKHRLYYNNKYQSVKRIYLNTNKETISTQLEKRPLHFPLFVGKRWKSHYDGKSTEGTKYKYTNTYIVTAYKKLETPMGILDVFKISMKQWSDNWSPSSTPAEATLYYSPKLKHVVRFNPEWRKNDYTTKADVKTCN